MSIQSMIDSLKLALVSAQKNGDTKKSKDISRRLHAALMAQRHSDIEGAEYQ